MRRSWYSVLQSRNVFFKNQPNEKKIKILNKPSNSQITTQIYINYDSKKNPQSNS